MSDMKWGEAAHQVFDANRPFVVTCREGQGPIDAIWQMYLMIRRDYQGTLGSDDTPADALCDLLEEMIASGRSTVTRDLLAKARLAASYDNREEGKSFDREGQETETGADSFRLPLASLLDDLEREVKAGGTPGATGFRTDLNVTLALGSNHFDDPALYLCRALHLVETRLKSAMPEWVSEEREDAEADYLTIESLTGLLEQMITACRAATPKGAMAKAALCTDQVTAYRGSIDGLGESLVRDLETAISERVGS